MKVEKTICGWKIINFKDRNGDDCSLQESSLAEEPAIWFGCNNN